jgi:hypothetical protein
MRTADVVENSLPLRRRGGRVRSTTRQTIAARAALPGVGYHARMRRWTACAALALWACGNHPATDGGADGGDTLAPAGAATTAGPVDGISCETHEQVAFHVHAHLAVFVAGEPKLVPAGVGIGPPLQVSNGFVVGGSCFSWLHTHDESGIIHVESPVARSFTLGDFFDVWGQPLSTSMAGPAAGAVSAFRGGAAWTGDPRALPLDDHEVLQIDVGAPVVPAQPYTFPAGY